MNNKNILVTGGAGAIGSNLVKSLIGNCNKLVILDDFSSGRHENVDDLINTTNVEIVDGNICDQSVIDEAFSHNIDQVYHLAVNFANQNSVDNPQKDLTTNGIGVIKVLEASVQNDIEKFLLSSSSCVYRPGKEAFVEHGPIELTTPYAITKMLSEYYVTFFNKFHNLPAVIVRYFNSYGPGDVPGRFRGVVPNFLMRAMNGLPLQITGDGSETRPFTYVQDIVDGTILAMNSDINSSNTFSGHPMNKENNIVYNIGNHNSVTILEFAELVNKICNNSAGIEFVGRRDWDMFPNRAVDNDKARNELNFKINHDLGTGLKLTHDWFKNQDFKLES